ncbi:hypothetical protein GOODEAATRI_020314 [Goodea atripinnis]|uniref:Uncharacterized protein n=1 Tax=Goodea atripinnis TaxID=208336 RepID=A0ABV0MV43_9TELE
MTVGFISSPCRSFLPPLFSLNMEDKRIMALISLFNQRERLATISVSSATNGYSSSLGNVIAPSNMCRHDQFLYHLGPDQSHITASFINFSISLFYRDALQQLISCTTVTQAVELERGDKSELSRYAPVLQISLH